MVELIFFDEKATCILLYLFYLKFEYFPLGLTCHSEEFEFENLSLVK